MSPFRGMRFALAASLFLVSAGARAEVPAPPEGAHPNIETVEQFEAFRDGLAGTGLKDIAKLSPAEAAQRLQQFSIEVRAEETYLAMLREKLAAAKKSGLTYEFFVDPSLTLATWSFVTAVALKSIDLPWGEEIPKEARTTDWERRFGYRRNAGQAAIFRIEENLRAAKIESILRKKFPDVDLQWKPSDGGREVLVVDAEKVSKANLELDRVRIFQDISNRIFDAREAQVIQSDGKIRVYRNSANLMSETLAKMTGPKNTNLALRKFAHRAGPVALLMVPVALTAGASASVLMTLSEREMVQLQERIIDRIAIIRMKKIYIESLTKRASGAL